MYYIECLLRLLVVASGAISGARTRAHGGTISVASVPADGATFRVELPLGT